MSEPVAWSPVSKDGLLRGIRYGKPTEDDLLIAEADGDTIRYFCELTRPSPAVSESPDTVSVPKDNAREELKRYRKKPVVIQAAQWFKIGDHAAVERPWSNKADYRCPNCGKGWGCHGVIKTLEDSQDGGHFVCPGDWIITGVQGENYACKPDIFDKTYGSEGEAADALERVTREEKSLRKYANERDQMCDILRDRAQAAEAEAERLRADAERYQHLRSERPTLLITGFFGNGCVNRTIEEVDAAIDAALEHK
jgi:hypothetical protein